MNMNLYFLKMNASQYERSEKAQGTFYLVDNTKLYLGAEYLTNNSDLVSAVERITANEAAIKSLEKDLGALIGTEDESGETTSISKMIADAIKASEEKMSAEIDADVLVETNRAKGVEEGLAEDIQANTDAITVLNGNSTVEGSVDKKVADAINTFATQISDDDTINTYKEILNYLATHKGEATEMAAAIDTLETKVGEKSVATQISEAITAENLDQYATDTELEALDGRVEVLEGKVDVEKVSTAVQSAKDYAKDYADGLAGNYATAAQGALADSAVQSVVAGTTNGTISVDGTEVSVAGLKSAAYTEASAYDTAGAATTAETNAKEYADGLASNYDAAGSATTAETNAKTYTDETTEALAQAFATQLDNTLNSAKEYTNQSITNALVWYEIQE